MKMFTVVIFATILVDTPMQAQAPAFEVATVKPTKDVSGSAGWRGRGDLMQFEGQTLRSLIQIAYRLHEGQVAGGPKWVDSERFDVNAKVGVPTKPGGMLRMLQTLLADRFKLTTHLESKDLPGFALVVAKSGLKIKPTADPQRAHSVDSRGKLEVTSTTLTQLSGQLAQILRIPVVNQTGTDGAFDFALEWSPEDLDGLQPGDVPIGASILTALQDKLGLKLEARKLPMQVYVIDHAEKPGEN